LASTTGHPEFEDTKSASIQVWVWIAGTSVFSIGVALVHTGHAVGDPIAAVGSVIVLLDMLFFGWLVFRAKQGVQPASSPAR
jgi:hypothetical protein